MAPPFEPFTLVDEAVSKSNKVSDDYHQSFSGTSFDIDLQLRKTLKNHYPNHSLTCIPAYNVNFLAYAQQGGFARAVLDKDEDFIAWRGYIQAFRSFPGGLANAARFAKYNYTWLGEEFVLYTVQVGMIIVQYILHEEKKDESGATPANVTDALITAVGEWQTPDDKYIYVFDNYWTLSRTLWDQVQKASWDDVILDDEMKKMLTDIVGKFFDSKDIYDDLGVPWRRGVMFHGPAGNGKTISIKAIMHTLFARKTPIPVLYVKSAPNVYALRAIFLMARMMAPCFLVLEDIDTIVTPATRSYFFNEVDGLEKNDGILMLASTNHLEQLDPGLSKRPSRFDRKYLFPNPGLNARILYCTYWRDKLHNKPLVKFPKFLVPAMARLMEDFSFAYMKEAFVATLLVLAGNRAGPKEVVSVAAALGGGEDSPGDDLDTFELWREFKKQVALLKEDMGSGNGLEQAFTDEHVGGQGEERVEINEKGITFVARRGNGPSKNFYYDGGKGDGHTFGVGSMDGDVICDYVPDHTEAAQGAVFGISAMRSSSVKGL